MLTRARLMARREAWAFDWSRRSFYVHIRGGDWTAHFKEEESDYASAFARAVAKQWCIRFKWPRQKGFAFTVYGTEGANMLAREWAFRGEHYYSIFQSPWQPARVSVFGRGVGQLRRGVRFHCICCSAGCGGRCLRQGLGSAARTAREPSVTNKESFFCRNTGRGIWF